MNNLLKKHFGCTVGAEVVGPPDGLKVIVSLAQRFASRECVKCQVGSKVGYVVCEELVGSAVGEEDINKKLGCTVGAEVVGPADGLKVIVSLVQRFASRVCFRCQVGSNNGSVVCEKLVGSVVCEELIKTNLDPHLVLNLLDQQMV